MQVTVIEPEVVTVDEFRLAELEDIIGTGMRSFVEVGNALAEVRDGGLYRSHYRTFEAYVADRWGWTRSAAYKYIDAAEVQDNVLPGVQLPTLSHAAMLAAFSTEQQRAIAPEIAPLSVKDATKVVKQHRDRETNTDAVSVAARKEVMEALHEDDATPAYTAFVRATEALIRVMAVLPADELTGVAGSIIALRDAYNAAREARRG